MSKTSKSNPSYNCLFRVTNDETNRAIIKEVRKMMKDYGTKWQLVVRGRKPKPGTGPYPYGSVPLKNAEELGIYIYLKPKIQQEESASRWRYISEHEKRNRKEIEELENSYNKLLVSYHKLENKLAILVGLIDKLESSKRDLSKIVNDYTGGNL